MRGIKHKNPMQTRHGRPRYKAYTVAQLLGAYEKTSIKKIKHKIATAISFKTKKSGVEVRHTS